MIYIITFKNYENVMMIIQVFPLSCCFRNRKKEVWYSIVLTPFQRVIGWNQKKYARITITHTFLSLHYNVLSLLRCLITVPSKIVFNQLPGTGNVNA